MGLAPIFYLGLSKVVKNSENLNQLLGPGINRLGYELIGCEYLSQGRHSLLRVYIDSPDGITLDDCQRVSEQLSAILDVEDPIKGQYSLEVSSPGLDRPLFTLPQYQKFIGHKIKIRMSIPIENRRNFVGVLTAVNDEQIVVAVDNVMFYLPFDHIEKANLIPEW